MNKIAKATPKTGLLPDGVYFNLPFEQYLAERRFSFHLGKAILISPLTAWSGYVDPTREDEDTTARKMGRALHCRLLEGEESFSERFAVKPENDGSYLEGKKELETRCVELCVPKSGNTDELCDRILDKDPDAKLWAVRLAEWEQETEGKTILTQAQWRETEIRARIAPMHPDLKNAFVGGIPEVSILYTDEETGVQCKTRIDLLRVKALIELKTFSNARELPIKKAVANTTSAQKYNMQARIELEAVRRAKDFARKGLVHGEIDQAWLTAFAEHPDHQFVWVFIQQGKVPEIRVRKFERYVRGASEGATENLHWSHGWDLYRVALVEYRDCLLHYGTDPNVPWLSPEPMRPFQDDEFGVWSFD